jgi:hypothetical protein
MAINSVARTVKVPHSDAKRAYIESINTLSIEDHKQFDSHRNSIHLDAEQRLLRTCPHAVLERASPRPKPKPAAQLNKSVVKRPFPNLDSPAKPLLSKRGCCTSGGARADRSFGHMSLHSTCEDVWGPHHGMLMLIKACESDLAKLN